MGDQGGKPVRHQAAFLQQHNEGELIAQGGAVIDVPPASCRGEQRGTKGGLGAGLVMRKRQGGTELGLGDLGRQSLDLLQQHAGGAGAALAGFGQDEEPVGFGREGLGLHVGGVDAAREVPEPVLHRWFRHGRTCGAGADQHVHGVG